MSIFVMYGDFSPSETRMVEKYVSNLPKRENLMLL